MRNHLLILVLAFSFVFAPVAPAFAEESTSQPASVESSQLPESPSLEEEPINTEMYASVEPIGPIEATQEEAAADQTEPSATTTTSISAPDHILLTQEITPHPNGSVNLTIRYGEKIAWTGVVDLPEEGRVAITPTSGGTAIEVDSHSLLAVLTALDAQDDAFAITGLDYYTSFGGSFFLSCLSAPAFGDACYQWQYVVDGAYAEVGADKWILEDTDTVYFYFGSPRRVTVPATATINQTFTTTVESYDPSDDSYDPLPGYVVGVTLPDPNNPFTPIEVATSTSATDGSATFTIATSGSYGVGLQRDGYYPLQPLTISEADGSGGSGGTGGGSSNTPPAASFDVSEAYAFLSTQNDGGYFGSDIVTDWSALAYAAPGAPAGAKASLISNLKSDTPKLSSVRDYERHVMALEALGINPYSGASKDYVAPIVASFDGTQIDNPALVNDDVFALIALMHAGYGEDDEIVSRSADFIVSQQRSDGSWEASPSLTAAAIQALSPLSVGGGAIARAENYLRAQQQSDGGWGDLGASDVFATSWIIQAIVELGEDPESWTTDGKSSLDFLASVQEEDGGMRTKPTDDTTRAWGTAYAIPAAKGLTWDDLLRDFSKPKVSAPDENDDTATTTATTTPTVPVSEPVEEALPPIATSTVLPALPFLAPTEQESNEPVSHVSVTTTDSDASEVTDAQESESGPALAAAVGNTEAASWFALLWRGFWHTLASIFSRIF